MRRSKRAVKAHFVAVEVSTCMEWEGEPVVVIRAGNHGPSMLRRAPFHLVPWGVSPVVKPFPISTAG